MTPILLPPLSPPTSPVLFLFIRHQAPPAARDNREPPATFVNFQARKCGLGCGLEAMRVSRKTHPPNSWKGISDRRREGPDAFSP